MTLKLLLIEDDRRLAALVGEYLRTRGCEVEVVHDGHAGLSAALSPGWDCVLLDLMLPGLNGVDVCRRLRERSDVPVLMITALDSEAERVLGLEAGADGYVCKPFSSPELLARVRAVARRYRGELRASAPSLTVGDLHLDLRARAVTVAGQPVALTTHEYDLLVVLAERAGVVLSRDRLLELTHADPAAAFDRSIDGHISRLRHKLGDDPQQPARIRTVRGAGYLLVPGGDR